MALDRNTIDALTQEVIEPYINDVIFENHPLLSILMKKKKRRSGTRYDVLLEYGKAGHGQFTGVMAPFVIGESDPITNAFFKPKTYTYPLAIPWEEDVDNEGEGKVLDIIETKIKNALKDMEEDFAERLFDRGTTTGNEWASLDDLIGTGACGGLTPTDLTSSKSWKSHLINVVTAYNDSPADEANLKNPDSDVYILNLIRRGIRLATYRSSKPDLVIMTQYLFDLAAEAYFKKFGGSPVDKRMVNAGIEHIVMYGATLVADDDISRNQTSDDDSRIYTLTTDHLYAYFNKRGMPFNFAPGVEMQNVNGTVYKARSRGGFVISNRRTHCRMYNIHSPRYYAESA